MSNNRIWMWGLLIVALGAAIWYRNSQNPVVPEPTTTRIVFVTGGSGPFWKMAVNGATAAAEEYNADLTVRTPEKEESLQEQTMILTSLKMSEIDGIAVSPLDADAQTRVINQMAEHLNVVTFDSDAPLSTRQCYVGTSNYRAGQLCVMLISEAIPEGGEVAVLVSNLTKHNTKERKIGLEDALQELETDGDGEGIQIVDFLIDEGNREACEANIRKAIEDHPDLDGFIAINGYHGPILLEVLKSEGKLADLKLVTFDDEPITLAGVESGEIHGTIAQDPYRYGYEAVRILTRLHHGKLGELPIVGGGAIGVPCDPIRKDDVADFRERLEQRLNGNPAKVPDNPAADAA
ncbi:MAG: substrate-binding domain-containing protein [Aeoliella sp.]